ncbi:MAG: HDOD domain-containing protein [Thiobacillaceae bacterium]|nr:HDOD domain-containing protein [Thiobacillaceae bacterium]
MIDTDKDERVVEAILAGGVKIPPMPTVMVELAALDRDEDAGPRQYATLIGRDPGLAGAVFRVVGSPVFGLRVKVDSLEKAITVLGIRTARAVVQGEALRGALNDPALEKVMAGLWQRANAVAEMAVAALKATRLRGVSQDQAFLLGIFHDCGVALACRRYPAYAQGLAAVDAGCPDLDGLDRACQTNHTVLGQTVARNWQLPADIALAIRHHHDTRLAGVPEPVVRLVVLLQFAMHLCNRRQAADDGEWPAWQARVAELFDRDAARLAELEAEILAGQA